MKSKRMKWVNDEISSIDWNHFISFTLDIQQLITKGNQLTQQLDTRLHTLAMNNKEINQIREIHNWACEYKNKHLIL